MTQKIINIFIYVGEGTYESKWNVQTGTREKQVSDLSRRVKWIRQEKKLVCCMIDWKVRLKEKREREREREREEETEREGKWKREIERD